MCYYFSFEAQRWVFSLKEKIKIMKGFKFMVWKVIVEANSFTIYLFVKKMFLSGKLLIFNRYCGINPNKFTNIDAAIND